MSCSCYLPPINLPDCHASRKMTFDEFKDLFKGKTLYTGSFKLPHSIEEWYSMYERGAEIFFNGRPGYPITHYFLESITEQTGTTHHGEIIFEIKIYL